MDDEDVVERVVQEEFDGAALLGMEDRSGMAHRTVRARLDGADREEVIVRWCVHDHLEDRFLREAAATTYVARNTNLPLAEILASDHSEDAVPHPYIVASFLPGTPRTNRFHQPHDLSTPLLREAGRCLGQLHSSMRTDCFGHVDPATDGARFEAVQDWPSLLRSIVERHINGLEGYSFEDLIPFLQETLDRHINCTERASSPALLHHDYRPANLLTRDGRVTGIVDWERALSGDPLYDVVKARENFAGKGREAQWDSFIEGYIEEAEVEDDPERRRFYAFAHGIEVLWAYPIWKENHPPEERSRVEEELRTTMKHTAEALSR